MGVRMMPEHRMGAQRTHTQRKRVIPHWMIQNRTGATWEQDAQIGRAL